VGGGGDGCGRVGAFSARGRSKNTREPWKGREKGLGRKGRREEKKTFKKLLNFDKLFIRVFVFSSHHMTIPENVGKHTVGVVRSNNITKRRLAARLFVCLLSPPLRSALPVC